jgi:hypothetical protein
MRRVAYSRPADNLLGFAHRFKNRCYPLDVFYSIRTRG